MPMHPTDNHTDNNFHTPPQGRGSTQPVGPVSHASTSAADEIRRKIAELYADEPDAQEEANEAVAAGPHRSKHQQYMYELTSSGKSQADIEQAWHAYYASLPEHEKHEVWHEFYVNHGHAAAEPQPSQEPVTREQVAAQNPLFQSTSGHTAPQPSVTPAAHTYFSPQELQPAAPQAASAAPDSRTVADIKDHLLRTVASRSTGAKHHLQSLAFGLGLSTLLMVLVMFGFLNERFIAPFMTPSRAISSTPIIVSNSTTTDDPTPKVIIPKINVELPVVYDQKSTREEDVQRALEDGTVHYPTTPYPGEKGNTAIFGHSSNNILNRGKYKFAFVLLNRLEEGDTFILTKDHKRYVYRVYKKHVVKPTDVHVLDTQDKPATASLITCDPPGTSLNRLVVVGEQISPDPGTNAESHLDGDSKNPTVVPGNAPSLWDRLTGWISG